MKLLIILFCFVQVMAFAQRQPGPRGIKHHIQHHIFHQRKAVAANVEDGLHKAALRMMGIQTDYKVVSVQTSEQIAQHETQVANINESIVPATEYREGELSCINPNLTCLSISNEKSEVTNYQNDLEVCDCLKNRFNLPIKDLSQLTPKELEEQNMRVEEGKLYASLMELKKNFVAKRDALLLESHFVSEEQKKTMLDVGQTKDATDFLTHMVETYKGKVRDEVYNEAFAMVDNHYSANGSLLDNLNSATKRPDSCFPFADYLKVSMIPTDESFWKSLLDVKDIKKGEWDYTELTNQYNYKNSDKKTIKAKLDFLNKNPTLKAIFYLGDEELQKRVYAEMRKALSPSSSCIKDGNCRSQFFNKGGNLQESLKSFYEDPKVKEMTIGVTYANTVADIAGVHNYKVGGLSLPALRMAYADGNSTYDNCDTNTFHEDAPACGDIFQNYCSELYSRKDEMIPQLEWKETNASYANDWLDDMEPEPAKNQGYLEFQNKMCEKLARKLPGTSKIVNLQAFKDSYCPKNKNECDGLDDAGLFKLFISKTQGTDKIFDDEYNLVKDEEGLHMLAEANSENKTAVSEFSISDLKRLNYSNSLSTFGQSSPDEKASITISELISQVHGESKSRVEDKANIGIEPLEKIAHVQTSDDAVDEGLGFFSTENLAEDFFNSSQGSQGLLGNHTYMDTAISEARNELNELKKEEAAIKNEMTEVRNQISTSSSSEINRELEIRLENLEKLLAEKEKTSQNYQGLISKLMEAQKAPRSAKAPAVANSAIAEDEAASKVVGIEAKKSTGGAVVSNRPSFSEEQNSTQRAPASVENFNTSAGMGGGAAAASVGMSSSVSQASRGGSRYNGALLSKYGIIVQETPGSTVSVAQETEGTRFQAMGAFREASNIPLEVSQKAFEKFKVNDLSALQELYQESLEKIDDEVVKILVSSEESDETLEFYAIKEDGKVVFQPIRKNKLSDLQNTLSQY
ncbi:MAG TPA: hypothetical protein VKY27_10110 [Bacteriovoracaceae bacterium]|nr:hypothetical protein [Bacteriovoracaceae bacterium]